ncbi:membrane protein [Grimontia sp. AD028]|uniref:ATPase of the AAA+ class n=2 Tax=Grimontia TaxID=246861 RepID=R1GS25_9GAMM|nr:MULTISPECIES: YijD family membrane protein [Grimontia]EOD79013.1 ATPase of the AAA+ class [Grimontia indica]KKD59895.1 membrane protein [Grimontia sp. AD028]NGN99720.1 YijD family membrane protein [Grimontia sedimenti]
MEQNHQSERKFLLLAVVAGLCGSASLATLFVDSVAFSVFPIIAFILAVYCFYQQHVNQPLTEGTPLIAFACFLVGAFGYTAFVRMQVPELGGNFFPIIVTMLLVFWVAFKMGWLSVGGTKKEETPAEE